MSLRSCWSRFSGFSFDHGFFRAILGMDGVYIRRHGSREGGFHRIGAQTKTVGQLLKNLDWRAMV